jgi:hypothetical protein
MDAPYTATNGNAEGFPSPITGARASFIYTKTYRLNWDYTEPHDAFALRRLVPAGV